MRVAALVLCAAACALAAPVVRIVSPTDNSQTRFIFDVVFETRNFTGAACLGYGEEPAGCSSTPLLVDGDGEYSAEVCLVLGMRFTLAVLLLNGDGSVALASKAVSFQTTLTHIRVFNTPLQDLRVEMAQVSSVGEIELYVEVAMTQMNDPVTIHVIRNGATISHFDLVPAQLSFRYSAAESPCLTIRAAFFVRVPFGSYVFTATLYDGKDSVAVNLARTPANRRDNSAAEGFCSAWLLRSTSEVRSEVDQLQLTVEVRCNEGLPLSAVPSLPPALSKPRLTVISFHAHHDANICVAADGEILVVLELERLFRIRHFDSFHTDKAVYRAQWQRAMKTVNDFVGFDEYDVAVFVKFLVHMLGSHDISDLVRARQWVTVDHHVAHALTGFYASPFHSAIILSHDGGGNDGHFLIFNATRDGGLRHMHTMTLPLSMGNAYGAIGALMPEVTNKTLPLNSRHNIHTPGVKMGYGPLGKPREEWIDLLRQAYLEFESKTLGVSSQEETMLERLRARLVAEGEASTDDEWELVDADAQDLAATSEKVFGDIVINEFVPFVEAAKEQVEGVVISGGCALNVVTNERMASLFSLPLYVPPAPNDAGLSVGGAWAVRPPRDIPGREYPLAYLGLPLFDLQLLPSLVTRYGAEQVDSDHLGQLLSNGAVIAVVYGRQEFGPRALGHRSLMAYPNKAEVKDKMNRIKFRQWWRPVAPVITEESAPFFFAKDVRSPYMTRAPLFTPEAQAMFPAVAHMDGSGRVQTVNVHDDAWLYGLLRAVERHAGHPILINTSFNTKGKPICNHIEESLKMLADLPDLDSVYVEGWLFHKDSVLDQTQ